MLLLHPDVIKELKLTQKQISEITKLAESMRMPMGGPGGQRGGGQGGPGGPG
jgi:hypothetical protein